MAVLSVRHPDGRLTDESLIDQLTIGRHETNQLKLTEGGVSRFHARVWVESGQAWIEDVGSSNGTFVDGQQVLKPLRLSGGERVALGDYALTYKPDEAALARRDTPGDQAVIEGLASPHQSGLDFHSSAVLKGLSGPWAGQAFSVSAGLKVGRGDQAQLRLEHPSISREHAQLDGENESVSVKDLGSANGTRVNGEAVQGIFTLKEGDIVQFGQVLFAFEAKGSPAIVRPLQAVSPKMHRRVGPRGAVPPSSFTRFRGLRATAWLLAVVVAGATGWAVLKSHRAAVVTDLNGGTEEGATTLQTALSECRTHAASETKDPDWEKAEKACRQALILEPINSEANGLIRKITFERGMHGTYLQGQVAMDRNREDEALEYFAKISPESIYYRKAKPTLLRAVEQVKNKARQDCVKYSQERFWDQAFPRCQAYINLACQNMSEDELYPPPNYRIRLKGRLGKRDWRPGDPVYFRFLVAREKVQPRAPEWRCPETRILRAGDSKAVSPSDQVRHYFQGRYKEAVFRQAMESYWTGKGNEAVAALQRVRRNMEQIPLHSRAEELRRNISEVEQQFTQGEAQLKIDRPEDAAVSFRDAMQSDQRLMENEADTLPSFYRRNMQQDMAAATYVRGKFWYEREDFKRACRLWKLGLGFYKGNIQLNNALSFCAAKAVQALEAAKECDDLPSILEMSVGNDGISQKVESKKTEWKCPN